MVGDSAPLRPRGSSAASPGHDLPLLPPSGLGCGLSSVTGKGSSVQLRLNLLSVLAMASWEGEKGHREDREDRAPPTPKCECFPTAFPDVGICHSLFSGDIEPPRCV